MAQRPILIAGATRPYPTETANGDAWRVDWSASGCRIAVIDGLGHGPGAAEAAAGAGEALARIPDAGPIEALNACHEALRRTRGAALFIVVIDRVVGTVSYAGVGNVDARLAGNGRDMHLPSLRGIAGSALPRLRAERHALPEDWTLLIHTDGVSNRFALADLSAGERSEPRRLADAILARWGRLTDDATVVVAAPAAYAPERST
jgi:hypothetical protein